MVGRDVVELESPTLDGWRRAMRQDVVVWDEKALGLNPASVGLMASPTRVVSTHVPEYAKEISWITNREQFLLTWNTIMNL